jgi:UDP:flavonoid glycosyltransferase YjiC (YdhE family)
MRILFTTRGSSGHVQPLAPVARACRAAGHDVLVAAQGIHGANVERLGLPLAPVASPAEEDWKPLMGDFASLDFDRANEAMIGRFFGGLDTRAALPDLLAVIDRWRPDALVRESWEFASTVAADLRGLPLARVGLAVAAVEELTVRTAAPVVDEVRAEAGLPPDPAGARLRAAPYLTAMPEALDPHDGRLAPVVRRFQPGAPAAPPPMPDLWPDDRDPLVYVTFGSVTAAPHLPYFPDLYRATVEALAPLPARVLLTLGQDGEPGRLGPLPPNVRAERWVPQEAVLPAAAAVVGHGGYGTTLGAAAAGVPQVVVPLFSTDQWANAEAVARAGAGIALDGDRDGRRVLGLPAPEVLAGLGGAVRRVLEDRAFREAAGRIAADVREMPPASAAVDLLEGLAGRR